MLRARDELAGKRVKCTTCGLTVLLPGPGGRGETAAPAPAEGPPGPSPATGNAPG